MKNLKGLTKFRIVVIIIISIILLGLGIFIIKDNGESSVEPVAIELHKLEVSGNSDVFSTEYQEEVDKKIGQFLENDYDLKNPLMIYNPYGTNELGVNVYFDSNEELEISYTISVENEKIDDFSRVLKNEGKDNYSKEHKYQIIGLVPGEINYLKLTGKNKWGKKIKANFKIDMTLVEYKKDDVLQVVNGDSSEKLTDGLFASIPFFQPKPLNLFDNNGIIRASLKVVTNNECQRIEFHNNDLYYAYDKGAIAVIDRLGKVKKTYVLEGYSIHHEYVLNKKTGKMIILATRDGNERYFNDNCIISLDINTGDYEELIDMDDFFPDVYSKTKLSEMVFQIGGEGYDWLNLNSLTFIGDNNNDIIVSSREMSTLMYIENIYDNPSIKWMIADETVWEGTKYSDLVLEKVGDFVSQAGQHTITYVEDKSLEPGQYYLMMFNNNCFQNTNGLQLSNENFPGTGVFEFGPASKYYKYLVDENAGTYKLVKEFDVEYSSIISSAQDVEDNHVIGSGMPGVFAEYDKNGKLIRSFKYETTQTFYRAYKYDFKNIWFE